MFSLDLRSIILLSGGFSLVVSLLLLFFRRSSLNLTQNGLGLWAAGPLLVFGATLLFATRGVAPDWVSKVLANLLLLSGVIGLYWGSQRFFGLALSLWLGGSFLLAAAALLSWFTLVAPNGNAVVLVATLFWAAIQFSHAGLVWRHGGATFSARFLALVLLAHGGVIALRFIATLTQLDGCTGLFDATWMQTIYLGTSAAVMPLMVIGFILLVTDRLRTQFEYLATYDALTGALMRRALIEMAELELARCRRHGRSMALLVMDLDHFKSINDTHGHQTGDRVLVNFVTRVAALLRRPDRLGRFGGEEFVLLLPETTLDEAAAVAERIRHEMEAAPDGQPGCTVSIGVTANQADDSRIDTLLARADQALYQAKAAGRNRIATA